jgi:chemotaxis protein histidine kinase CheA
VVSVADDGNGVDLERVRAKARAAGLPHRTDRDVLEALFCDGLTTRDQVTELSGRGVGTSAVRAACRELGGDAQLLTIPSRGTELRCTLPATVLASSRPRPRAPGEPANPMRMTLRMAKILADTES